MTRELPKVDDISCISVCASEEDYERAFDNDYAPPWFCAPIEPQHSNPGEPVSLVMMIGGDMLGNRAPWGSQDGRAASFACRVAGKAARCIVPASLISYRVNDDGEDLGIHIQAVDGSVLRLGAVYRRIEGVVSLVAVPSSPRIASFASWMPLILGDADWLPWLKHGTPSKTIRCLIKPCPDEGLQIGFSPLTANFAKTCQRNHAAAFA